MPSQPEPKCHSIPLAKTISFENADPQISCPLFVVIPTEIRKLISKFVLTAYSDCNRLYPKNKSSLRSWQFAYITTVDITMQQVFLEKSWVLHGIALALFVKEREEDIDIFPDDPLIREHVHKGIRFAYNIYNPSPKFIRWRFEDEPGLGDMYDLSPYIVHASLPKSIVNLGCTARKITKLTIRLGQTDWWTWVDAPDVGTGLSLSPAYKNLGDGITDFLGLKTLEMALETFTAKKPQLERVVEEAKEWYFPWLKGLSWSRMERLRR
ncbi:hypothetical protein M501DRAFT_987566 [Patellaria atrata CBS 101060]|uniref:Uncharacterized protein n=1 Tax=Patellaria atrata CBS 101060 TaxID=1346257 RepID=A0A9P4S6B1_9PEZI|nr:hypothetical protein M501DRAFT_987566 [Patellaria atrata CBS 101060]